MAEISHILRYPNGQVRLEEKRVNGKRVRGTFVYDINNNVIAQLIYRYDSGQMMHIQYRNNSISLHNEYGPAMAHYEIDGKIAEIAYYHTDLMHRTDYPAKMEWRSDQIIIEYYLRGKMYNSNGPADINIGINGHPTYILYSSPVHRAMSFDDNGQIENIAYLSNSVLHSIHRPAILEFYSNGNLKSLYYMKYGVFHNTAGPAIKTYYVNGQIEGEVWMKNGRVHRSSFGPITRYWSRSGRLIKQRYYQGDLRPLQFLKNNVKK